MNLNQVSPMALQIYTYLSKINTLSQFCLSLVSNHGVIQGNPKGLCPAAFYTCSSRAQSHVQHEF